jgi:hypothetical protein
MASIINASSTGAGGLISTGDSSGVLQIQTNTSTTATFDASGNVGIGRTSVSYKFEVNDTSLLSSNQGSSTGTVGTALALDSKTSGAYATGQGSALNFQITNSAGSQAGCKIASINNADNNTAELVFYPRNYGYTEAMRINQSGNVLVGTTSSVKGTPKFQSVNASDVSALFQCGNTLANNIVSWMNTTSGTRYHVAFGDGSSYTERGFISTNGSTTTYSTTSDYRLKDNIIPMDGALDIVNKLKPVTYNWKENGLSGQGFIAHELAEVVPDAVVGEKDAVNEDGSIKPQSIDTSFLVATLTAAIQELNAKVDAQALEIKALKAQ